MTTIFQTPAAGCTRTAGEGFRFPQIHVVLWPGCGVNRFRHLLWWRTGSLGPSRRPHSMKELAVLGVDLGSKNWRNTGTAWLAFTVNGQVHWTDARTDVVGWPTAPISAKTMAEVLDAAALELSVAAVSIDGPQGWRDPQARRSFPGRLCELQARTPGKTCVYQKTLPGNYSGWARFSI